MKDARPRLARTRERAVGSPACFVFREGGGRSLLLHLNFPTRPVPPELGLWSVHRPGAAKPVREAPLRPRKAAIRLLSQ
ncbi:hypothetical protein NDU88_001090 [Pleurodeles waltl]|uniref:Uncharacterized protein n=1 Tax=Pleurodeles waltl TaxID=8319 RepID=A0AAV7L8G8_PLEWA|nr:hypothetical protein NDU88_001090 [Pleurodeles waltl]